MKKWFQQKTTWVGIVAIVGAIGGMATGQVDPVTGIQSICGGLAAIFLRQAVQQDVTGKE